MEGYCRLRGDILPLHKTLLFWYTSYHGMVEGVWYKPTTAIAGDTIQIAYGMVWMGAGWATQWCHATVRWAVLWAGESYCVQPKFLLGDCAVIWYRIVWHCSMVQFGMARRSLGLCWMIMGWWVAQWNRWQCAQGATCHRCHQTICHPPTPILLYFLVPAICHPSPQYQILLYFLAPFATSCYFCYRNQLTCNLLYTSNHFSKES